MPAATTSYVTQSMGRLHPLLHQERGWGCKGAWRECGGLYNSVQRVLLTAGNLRLLGRAVTDGAGSRTARTSAFQSWSHV